MSDAPQFEFRLDIDHDRIHLTITVGDRAGTYVLDGLEFEVNPLKTLPDAYRGHADRYLAAIRSFREHDNDAGALRAHAGS